MDAGVKARRGDLIVFSTGEYSDYGYAGHFVALEDITTEHFQNAREEAERRYRIADEAQDNWTRESGAPYPPSEDKHSAFIAALIRSGLLVSVAVTEHHIGSYGDIEL